MVDADLASFLLCLMKKEGMFAQNFLAKLSKKSQSLSSGYAFLNLLIDSTIPQTVAEYDEVQKRIEQGDYFQVGMTNFEEQRQRQQHISFIGTGSVPQQLGPQRRI